MIVYDLPNKMKKSTFQHKAMELELQRYRFLQNIVQNLAGGGSYLDSNLTSHMDLNHFQLPWMMP